MESWLNEPQSFPEWIERSYETLVSYTADQGRGVPSDRVHEVLVANDETLDDPADARYAVKRLLERGRLYEVGGEIRITDLEA